MKELSSFNEFCAVFRSGGEYGERRSSISDLANLQPGLVKLLLCYDDTDLGLTRELCEQCFSEVVGESTRNLSLAEHCYLWNCTGFTEAQEQIGKREGHVLLLLLFRGEVVDRAEGRAAVGALTSDDGHRCFSGAPLLDLEIASRIRQRLASFFRCLSSSGNPVSAVVKNDEPLPLGGAHKNAGSSYSVQKAECTTSLSINVAYLLELGCKTMRAGKAIYAEKIFSKALLSLDAVTPDVFKTAGWGELADFNATLSSVLAWTAMAQLVQQERHQINPNMPNALVKRLRSTDAFQPWREKPLSDVSRALALNDLIEAAETFPLIELDVSKRSEQRLKVLEWSGENPSCSLKSLQAFLSSSPNHVESRRKFVITLFLAGDLERTFTEVLKLQSLGDEEFTRAAMEILCVFCGPAHVLVKALEM